FGGRRGGAWGGSGGSWVHNDLDARMTVAYVMNRHLESNDVDARSVNIVNAAYDSLAEMRGIRPSPARPPTSRLSGTIDPPPTMTAWRSWDEPLSARSSTR